METSSKLNKLLKNKIKVYPVIKNFKFAVCVEDKCNFVYRKTKTIGEYKHTTTTINKALLNSIDYIHKKITNLERF